MALEEEVDLEALKLECQSLRKLMQALVIVLLVLSASLNVFLLREVTLVRGDLRQRRQVIHQYEEKGFLLLDSFLSELRKFAGQNPDFAPILNRYFPATNQVSAPLPETEAETNTVEEPVP